MSTGALGSIAISDGVRDVVFDVLARVCEGGWDWSEEAIIRRTSDGALFYVSDSGCSCSSFGDNLTTADLIPLRTVEGGFRKAVNRADMRRSYKQGEDV
ncbi:DUF7574 domain-containing protein [Kribbella sp. WER1]